MKKFYKTKKRKREFRLTYIRIEYMKSAIHDMVIENETHIKYNNHIEAESNKRLIAEFEKELKTLQDEGWEIDYAFTN